MTVAKRGSPCLVNSCKISHLGMKPVRGGRPARDRRTMGAKAVRRGAFVQEIESVLIERAPLILKIRKVEEVMKI